MSTNDYTSQHKGMEEAINRDFDNKLYKELDEDDKRHNMVKRCEAYDKISVWWNFILANLPADELGRECTLDILSLLRVEGEWV